MIRFILGEDRHVKYFVHSVQSEYFVIKEASWRLLHNGEVGSSGVCQVSQEDRGSYVDVKLQPTCKSRLYVLEITLRIADEMIKNREQMEVI